MVGLNDLLIIGPTPGESVCDEVFQNLLINVDQIRQRTHDDHVSGSGVAGGPGKLVESHSEALAVSLELKFLSVVHDDSAVGDFVLVVLIRVFVESHEHVQLVAGTQNRLGGNPGLRPGRASSDLRRKCGEGLNVISDLGVGLGETLSRGDNALTALSGESNYKIRLLQFNTP